MNRWAIIGRPLGRTRQRIVFGQSLGQGVVEWFSIPYRKYNRARRFTMNYKVVVHESEEGFSISCPGLPGCWSQGETETEALENIQDAIREYLAAIDDLVKGQDVREVKVAV
jgi:predicted RNase H-like HicB family nuclease